MSDKFFDEVQAAAVLKHGILERYLPVFANKTGSTAGEVLYIDCYAGAGRYRDGSPGSPALALEVARRVAGYRGRASLRGHLIENDAKSFRELEGFVEEQAASSVMELHKGDALDCLPGIIERIPAKTPLFVFVDPFGLPIPFELMVAILGRGGRMFSWGRSADAAATEILLNFSLPGVRRNCGHLTSEKTSRDYPKARNTILQRNDSVLGGGWWRKIWESGRADAPELIRRGYIERLREKLPAGWGHYSIPVRDTFGGAPDYYLILFSQHRDGLWHFNESVSSASEEWREWCHANEGLLELEPLDLRADRWISEIANNLRKLLDERPAVHLGKSAPKLYGQTMGLARATHVRKAWERLYRDGVTDSSPKGIKDLSKATVRRAT